MHRRISSTIKVWMALFLAVFGTNLLPVTAAYALDTGEVTTLESSESEVQTLGQEVCPDTTFTAEAGGWVKYDDLSSTSFVVPQKTGFTVTNICYKASTEVKYPGVTATVTSTVTNDKGKIQNLSHVSVYYTKNQAPTGSFTLTMDCEEITIAAGAITPADGTVTFTLDGDAVTAGTHTVVAGSHTVVMLVNGEQVDSETVNVEECTDPVPATPQINYTVEPCTENDLANRVTVGITNTDDDTNAAVIYTLQFKNASTDAVVKTFVLNSIADGANSYHTYINELTAGSYYIYLTGDDGTTATSNTFVVNECNEEPTRIPLPSGIADICGTANDTVPLAGANYSIKTDSGWVQVGGSAKYERTITYETAADFVFIPSEGWVLSQDGTEATYTFTDWGTPCPATAGIVTFSEVCGTKNDKYTIPTTANVIYKVNGEAKEAGTYKASGTITVVAEAAPGYVLTAPYTATHTFSTEPCPVEPTCPKNTEWSDINKNEKVDEGECFKKVFVCKYVGTPGINERLQTGDNPISVSVNAIKDFQGIGSYFNDAQGRSYVLAYDIGQAEPDVSECPGRENPTVVVLDTPCVEFGETGSFTIRVTNNNDYAVKYRVNIEGGAYEVKKISANSYYDFTFSGYAIGTYTYRVFQQVAHDAEIEMTVPAFDSRIAPERDFEFTWERVARGTVTLEQCDAEEVVATAPTFLEPTCDITTGRVIIPTKTGVTYKISSEVKAAGTYNYPASSSVTVIAEATSAAYELTGTKTWTHTFAAVPTNCVLGTTDVCPNIEGSQATIPIGYTKDSNGNCNKTVGQVLATSVTTPDVLPATGAASFLSQWLPLLAGALTYFVTRSARNLKKA